MQYLVRALPPTLNLDEAAAVLKVHPNTLLKMVSRCELPAAKIGRAFVFKSIDVLEHVERSINMQTAQRLRRPRFKPP